MASGRVQRQIDRLLDEGEERSVQDDWNLFLRWAKPVLTF